MATPASLSSCTIWILRALFRRRLARYCCPLRLSARSDSGSSDMCRPISVTGRSPPNPAFERTRRSAQFFSFSRRWRRAAQLGRLRPQDPLGTVASSHSAGIWNSFPWGWLLYFVVSLLVASATMLAGWWFFSFGTIGFIGATIRFVIWFVQPTWWVWIL